jgi:heme/copper-type cytochrome/quinol oxidase subunit 1
MMKLNRKTGGGTVSLIVLASLAVLMCKVTGAGTGADTVGVEKSSGQTVVWTMYPPLSGITDGAAELKLGFSPAVHDLSLADFTLVGGGGALQQKRWKAAERNEYSP